MNNLIKNKLSNFTVLNITSLICFLCLSTTVWANPQGGKVVDGNATITTPSAKQTVIHQSSDKAIINWDQFNIDSGEHTKFVQPSAGSVTLNRVVGNDPSKILGQLSANGKLVLVNPNGVFFGPDSKVDVAAMIATTNDITNDDFMAGRLNFTIPGNPGAQIINQGTMTIQEGGLVALVAPFVQNNGLIQARLGKVVLASANTFTLDLYGDDLILFEADNTITEQLQDAFGNALDSAIKQSGVIEADGGYVLLTTDVAKNVVDNAINMTGIIKAQSVEEQGGTIILNAGEGKTYVSGQLDASAPDSGDGGFIETSGAKVVINEVSRIDTSSILGNTGQWLLDPTDYYISASDGDITGETLAAYLGLNNVTIQTATTGSENGDIYVNDDISWTTSNKLTLKAYRNIFVNNDITGIGGGDLDLISGDSGNGVGTVAFSPESRINLTGSGDNAVQIFYNTADYTSPTSFSSYVSSGDLTAYMLVNDVYELQNMNANLSGNYALSQDIDASDTVNWNGGDGFVPIGQYQDYGLRSFLGKFNGNGFSIENLYIHAPYVTSVGLFGDSRGIISNTKIKNADVTGMMFVGALLGRNFDGTVYNCSSSGVVRGVEYIGGLVGGNLGNLTSLNPKIINSSSSANISCDNGGGFGIGGGLAGVNHGEIFYSFATGDLLFENQGSETFGGLVGNNDYGLISNCYATGNVAGYLVAGSLVAENSSTGGRVINSYSIGTVSSYYQGGMLGYFSSCLNCSGNYWNIDKSGFSTSSIGIGLSDFEMKQQSSFTGWDFINVWSIDEGVSYPTFKWQESNSDITPDILLVSDQLSTNSDTGNISYTENEAGIIAFPTSSFSGTHCPSVEVYFENGFVAGQDYLDFVQSGNVTGSYDPSTGVLTLSGLATVEEYKTVLNSVRYRNSSDNPDDNTKKVTVKVGRDSSYRLLNITAVNDMPVADSPSNVDFQENSSGLPIFPELTLDDVDNTELTGATIQLNSGFSAAEDNLVFVDQNNISGSYDPTTGILQLTGSASLADYQTAIRSVQYVNTSDAPSTTQRSASIIVSDGEDASGQLLSTVAITPVNDAPILDTTVYGGNTPTGGIHTTTVDVASNTGVLITDLMAAGGTGFVTDVDSNNIGIAVTSLDAPDGTWQYTLNNGTTWQDFPSVSDSSALLLTAEQQTKVRYVPNNMTAGATIERAIAFFAWDRSYGNNGESGVNVNVRGDDTAYSIDWARGYLSLSKADISSGGGIGTTELTGTTYIESIDVDQKIKDHFISDGINDSGTDGNVIIIVPIPGEPEKPLIEEVIEQVSLPDLFEADLALTLPKTATDFLLINAPEVINTPKDEAILSENAIYARFADDIYSRKGTGTVFGSDWQVLAAVDYSASGFTAGVYRNKLTEELIVSFGGTTAGEGTLNDIQTDIDLINVYGRENLQHAQLREFVDKVIDKYGNDNLTFTGHSLGGGIAQYASMYTGNKSVTFNAAPLTLNKESLDELPANYAEQESLITNIRTPDDPLSIILNLVDHKARGINTDLDLLDLINSVYTTTGSGGKVALLEYLGLKMTDDLNSKLIKGLVDSDSLAKELLVQINNDVDGFINIVGAIYAWPNIDILGDLSYGENKKLDLTGGHSMSNITQHAAAYLPEGGYEKHDFEMDLELFFSSTEVSAVNSSLSITNDVAGIDNAVGLPVIDLLGNTVDALAVMQYLYNGQYSDAAAQTAEIVAAKMIPFFGQLTAASDIAIWLGDTIDDKLQDMGNKEIVTVLKFLQSKKGTASFTDIEIREMMANTDIEGWDGPGMQQGLNALGRRNKMVEQGLIKKERVAGEDTYSLTFKGALAIYMAEIPPVKDGFVGRFGEYTYEGVQHDQALLNDLSSLIQ